VKNELPKPTGVFAVGRTSIEIVDDSRVDPMGVGPDDARRLVVWIWYPAEATSAGSTPSPYLPQGWEASDNVMGAPIGTMALHGHSHDNAPIEGELGRRPFLLFSASGFSPLSYAATLENLASHGYVVASISHTHDAPITVFRDGTEILGSVENLRRITAAVGDPMAAGMDETFAFRAEMAMLKRDDMKSTVDLLMDVPHPVVGLIDPARIGALGHSLGGNAALEWCRADSRCQAAVNLDGAIWTEVGETGLTKAAMVIAAQHPEMLAPPEDLVAAGAFPTVEWCLRERSYLFDGWQRVVDSGGSLATIEGASHANFSDVQFVTMTDDSPMRRVLGSVEPEAMWRQTSELLLEFYGKNL
jgi:dienelactone hydrolase